MFENGRQSVGDTNNWKEENHYFLTTTLVKTDSLGNPIRTFMYCMDRGLWQNFNTPMDFFFCPYKIVYIFKAFYDLHRKEEDTFICFYHIRISIYLSINNEIKNRLSLVYTGVERTRYWGNIAIFAHIFQYLLLQICIWFILVLIFNIYVIKIIKRCKLCFIRFIWPII